MKTTSSSCCGSYTKRKIKIEPEIIPANPKIINGVAVIYVGSGNIKVKGAVTNSLYYASDHNRHFKIFSEDVHSVLQNKSIIFKP